MNDADIINLINLKEQEMRKLQEEINILKANLGNIENELQTVSFTKDEKVKILMDYFKGRDDVYPYLSIDKKDSTKKYYIPACNNEWKSYVCNKTMKRPCKTC